MTNKSIDFAIGLQYGSPNRSRKFAVALSHLETYIIIAVNNNLEKYTTFEQFTLVYQTNVWLLYLLSILIYIIFLSVCKVVNQEFIGFNHIFYSTFLVTLGSPIASARSTGGRQLLMCFMLGMLIFRTVYVGKMYDMIRNKVSPSPPDSLDELIQKDYKVISEPQFMEKLKSDPRIHNRTVCVWTEDMPYQFIFKSLSKTAFVVPSVVFMYLQRTTKHFKLFHIMKQRIGKEDLYIHFQQYSTLRRGFNPLIMKFRDHGFLQKWKKQYKRHNSIRQAFNQIDKPQLSALYTGKSVYCCIFSLYLLSFLILLVEFISVKFPFLWNIYNYMNN